MPNNVYNQHDKVKMVELYNATNNNARKARELFAGLFPDRPIPGIVTIVRVIKQFKNSGCVQGGHKKISYPTRQVQEDLKIQICASYEANPVNSLKNVTEEFNASESTVYRVVKIRDNKFGLIEFAEEVINKINMIANFLKSEECTFGIDHEPNRQNVHYWLQINLNFGVDTYVQYKVKVNVWVGIIRDQVFSITSY